MTAILTRTTRTAGRILGKLRKGATAVEYGLLVALIAAALIGSVALFGTNLSSMFAGIGSKIVPSAEGTVVTVVGRPADEMDGFNPGSKCTRVVDKVTWSADGMSATPVMHGEGTDPGCAWPAGSVPLPRAWAICQSDTGVHDGLIQNVYPDSQGTYSGFCAAGHVPYLVMISSGTEDASIDYSSYAQQDLTTYNPVAPWIA